MSTDFWPKMTLKANTERNQIPLYFIMRVNAMGPGFDVLVLIWPKQKCRQFLTLFLAPYGI